jgi:hypothetical protein
LVENIHSGNLLIKWPIQFNIRGLTIDKFIERKTGSDLFERELVQMRDSDLLKRQLVKNQLINPNSMQSNDISVNLITGVNFLRTICPISCVIL